MLGEYTIGSAGLRPARTENHFEAPIGQAGSFDIDTPELADKKITAAWWVPVSNFKSLGAFEAIKVEPDGEKVKLTFQPNEEAWARIAVYAGAE